MSDQIINTDSEAQYTGISSFHCCVNLFYFLYHPVFFKKRLAVKLLFPFPAIAERVQLLMKMPLSIFKL